MQNAEAHHRDAARAEGAGRAHLHRRLRHRLLVAQLPEAPAHRHASRSTSRSCATSRPTPTTPPSPPPSSPWPTRLKLHGGGRGRGDRGAARVPAAPRLRPHAGLPVQPAAARRRVRSRCSIARSTPSGRSRRWRVPGWSGSSRRLAPRHCEERHVIARSSIVRLATKQSGTCSGLLRRLETIELLRNGVEGPRTNESGHKR